MRRTKKLYLLLLSSFLIQTPLTSWEREDPLNLCRPSVLIKAGATPSLVTGREEGWLTQPSLSPPTQAGLRSYSFHEQFETPYLIGVEIGWNFSGYIQAFVEYNYTESKGRTLHSINPILGNVEEVFSHDQTHFGFLGIRHYACRSLLLPCCMGRIAPYIGLKAGVAWEPKLNFDLYVDDNFVQGATYFKGTIAITAGWLMGVEWWFTSYMSATFQADAVVTQGPRGNHNIVIEDPQLTHGVTNLNIGAPKWKVSFPLTVGLRYTF